MTDHGHGGGHAPAAKAKDSLMKKMQEIVGGLILIAVMLVGLIAIGKYLWKEAGFPQAGSPTHKLTSQTPGCAKLNKRAAIRVADGARVCID